MIVLNIIVKNEYATLYGIYVLNQILKNIERHLLKVVVVVAKDLGKFGHPLVSPLALFVGLLLGFFELFGFGKASLHTNKSNPQLIFVTTRCVAACEVALADLLGKAGCFGKVIYQVVYRIGHSPDFVV